MYSSPRCLHVMKSPIAGGAIIVAYNTYKILSIRPYLVKIEGVGSFIGLTLEIFARIPTDVFATLRILQELTRLLTRHTATPNSVENT